MSKVLSSALIALMLFQPAVGQTAGQARGPKFYPDDPLRELPPPLPAKDVKPRKLNDFYDYLLNDFGKPGEHWERGQPGIPAKNVNTLGEVPEDDWYANRHYFRPMTLDELRRGPDRAGPPAPGGKWKVVAAKTEGITPGFTVLDARGRRYIIKFDPLKYPEIATAADVIGSKFFYALGYYVPENYVISLRREDLEVGEKTTLTDERGRERRMTAQDIGEILMKVPVSEDGSYRAVASLFLPGKPVGPHRYHGTRRDDPNDIVAHEHRRDLRGLRVFAAWLGHDDSRAINSLDMLDARDGVPFVKHYLIDFGSILGSASDGPNSPRSGNVPFFSWSESAKEFFSLGLYVPAWMRADYPDLPSVGRFEWETFDPVKWTPEYYNPAFANMLPDDAFWAARQVMAFSDEQIREIVKTGRYSDPRAEGWVTECLVKRRDKVGRAWLNAVLALDRFAVRDGRLAFVDLSAQHGLGESGPFSVAWAEYDNARGAARELPGATGEAVPNTQAEYLRATVTGRDAKRSVRVYLRAGAGGYEVIGVERSY
jgi:hypothetical protein